MRNLVRDRAGWNQGIKVLFTDAEEPSSHGFYFRPLRKNLKLSAKRRAFLISAHYPFSRFRTHPVEQ